MAEKFIRVSRKGGKNPALMPTQSNECEFEGKNTYIGVYEDKNQKFLIEDQICRQIKELFQEHHKATKKQ